MPKLWNSWYFLGFSLVFGPGLSNIGGKAVQEAAKAARRPLSEAGRPLAEHVGS